jgi:tetratricopeptide (TPR) repeat protein
MQLLVTSIHYYGGNLEKAKEKLQEAEKLCLFNPHANSKLYGHILMNLGDIYVQQDALNDSEMCYQKALSIWKDKNDTFMQGLLYSALANLYRRLWRLDEAVTLYQSAIQCHEGANTPAEQGENYKGLGVTVLMESP